MNWDQVVLGRGSAACRSSAIVGGCSIRLSEGGGGTNRRDSSFVLSFSLVP